MRIFATGFTKPRFGNRSPKGIAESDVFEMFLHALRASGHTVERRPWELGDGPPWVSRPDLIVVDAFSPLSWTTGQCSLQILQLMGTTDIPILFTHSDWQINVSRSNFRSLLNHPGWLESKINNPRLFFRWDGTNLDLETVKRYADDILEGARRYTYDWPDSWTYALHLWPWGDLDRIHKYVGNAPKEAIRTWDPSSFVLEHGTVRVTSNFNEKEDRWVVATLQKTEDWVQKQQLSWPVSRYGKWARNWQPEASVIEDYKTAWGVLAPSHGVIDASGWVRLRHVFAAAYGSVLLMDPRDQAIFGAPYQVSGPAIEKMNPADRRDLALDQRRWLFDNITPYEDFVSQANRIAYEAASTVRKVSLL